MEVLKVLLRTPKLEWVEVPSTCVYDSGNYLSLNVDLSQLKSVGYPSITYKLSPQCATSFQKKRGILSLLQRLIPRKTSSTGQESIESYLQRNIPVQKNVKNQNNSNDTETTLDMSERVAVVSVELRNLTPPTFLELMRLHETLRQLYPSADVATHCKSETRLTSS